MAAKSIQSLVGKSTNSAGINGFGSSLESTLNENGIRVFKKTDLPFKPIEHKECEKHGAYVYRASNGDPFQERTWEECPKCKIEESTRARLGGRDGVAKRFQSCNFDNYKVTNQPQHEVKELLRDFAKHFTNHLEMGTPVLMIGSVGTGKTHLASAVANQIAVNGYDTIFRSVSEIVRTVRDCWGSSGAESRMLELYRTVDLLIVDEVGIFSSTFNNEKKTMTDNEHKILFDIINGRYEDMKPTIMISNLTIDKFTEAVGQRITSRIQHNGLYLPFTWSDYRAA